MVAQQAKRESHLGFTPQVSQGTVVNRKSSDVSSVVRLPELTPRKEPIQLASAEKEKLQSASSSLDEEDHDNRIETQGQRKLVASGEEAQAADQEDLVNQLKTVIRAQHAKIEDLRKKEKEHDTTQAEKRKVAAGEVEVTVSTNVHLQMIEELKRDAIGDREALGRMTSQVRRLQNHVKDLREKNQDLKLANKRYAGMLSNLGPHGAIAAVSSSAAAPISSTAVPIADQLLPQPPQVGAGPAVDPTPVASPPSGAEAGPLTARVGKVDGTMRLAQATRGVFGLWREETPAGILTSMMGSVCNLLQGGPPAITTLFVVDPWLRSAMETRSHDTSEDAARLQPTKFYLKGQVTVDGYQRQPGRVEPPRFADLSGLPKRSLGQLILPVHAKDKPMYAVLQVVIPRAAESSPRHRRVGRPRARDALEGLTDEENSSEQTVALTDAQSSALELLCGTAASIIEMQLRSSDENTIRRRSEECLAIAAEISSVPRLTDFEHSVKILLLKFFHVGCVRLCFFDSDLQVLLTAPMRPHRSGGNMAGVQDQEDDIFKTAAVVGRRNLQRISTMDGIVGKCVRKMQVIHSESLAGSVEVSERADGVDMAGWTTDINMLTGPMVANLSEKVLTIGTLQIIEKKNSSVDSSSTRTSKASKRAALECVPFSEEDQRFFSAMLKVLGLAAYRTMQLQARSDKENVAIHVEKLLER